MLTIVLCIYGILLSAAHIYFYIYQFQNTHPLDHYSLALNILCTGLVLFFAYKNKVLNKGIKLKKISPRWVVVTIVFLGLTAFRVTTADYASIGLDEHAQWAVTKSMSPLKAGTVMHQPHGDIVFNHATFKFFGYSPKLLRLQPVLFTIFASFMLFYLIFKASNSTALGLVAALFFNQQILVSHFASEGRPLAHSAFLAFIVLTILVYRPWKNHDRILLFVASVFFLNAIGWQPPFVLLFAFLGLILISIKKSTYNYTDLLIFPLAVLAIAPIQYHVATQSPPRFSNYAKEWSVVAQRFGNAQVDNILSFYTTSFVFAFVCVLLGIGFYIFAKKKRKKIFSDLENGLFIFFIASGFFVFSILAYLFLFDWWMMPYYQYLAIPIFIASGFLVLCGILKELSLKKQTTLLVGVICLCASFYIYNKEGQIFSATYKYRYLSRHDHKSLFRLLNTEATNKDALLATCLNKKGNWCPYSMDNFVYYNKSKAIDLAPNADFTSMLNELNKKTKFERLFLILIETWSNQKDLSEILDGVPHKVTRLEEVSLWEIDLLRTTLKDFLNNFVKRSNEYMFIKHDSANSWSLIIELVLALHSKDINRIKAAVSNYEALPVDNKIHFLQQFIHEVQKFNLNIENIN